MKAKTQVLTSRFQLALLHASVLHAKDVRKGTSIPYVEHLLGVASLVLADGGSEDEVVGALLHDALEDHAGEITKKEIKAEFGKNVLSIIESCSDTPPGYRGGKKPSWDMRKNAYLRHLKRASREARRVSLADKLHNARAILADYREIGDRLWERFTVGKTKQLWYYRSLVSAFKESGVRGRMIDEFERVVAEIERLTGSTGTPGRRRTVQARIR